MATCNNGTSSLLSHIFIRELLFDRWEKQWTVDDVCDIPHVSDERLEHLFLHWKTTTKQNNLDVRRSGRESFWNSFHPHSATSCNYYYLSPLQFSISYMLLLDYFLHIKFV
jgi:hypothetical protein